jgi:ring-1,2-phenylacetyl-CoA epoxidase subunit PaaD
VVKQVDEVTRVEAAVRAALGSVHDPEIPPLTLTDLGIVERVVVTGATVDVELLPTFAGCPALDAIRSDATRAVRAVADGRDVVVRFVTSPPWTSDRISADGREALRTYGLTPPGSSPVFVPLASLGGGGRGANPVPCPFCGSDDTELESAFGPTLCRTTHFCRACRNPFEGFKPKL